MYNCIYSGHCTQMVCDKSCPTLVETTYLLERNNISMSSDVFHKSKSEIDRCLKVLDSADGRFLTLIDKSTVSTSELLTYCGICQRWKGSRLHCTVYNLKFSQYVESIRNTWTTKNETEQLEYMRIWASTAKLLVISNLDYVNFRDFECQTLLTLLQSRENSGFTTIVVSPPTSDLVGSGQFFNRLITVLNKSKYTKEGKK